MGRSRHHSQLAEGLKGRERKSGRVWRLEGGALSGCGRLSCGAVDCVGAVSSRDEILAPAPGHDSNSGAPAAQPTALPSWCRPLIMTLLGPLSSLPPLPCLPCPPAPSPSSPPLPRPGGRHALRDAAGASVHDGGPRPQLEPLVPHPGHTARLPARLVGRPGGGAGAGRQPTVGLGHHPPRHVKKKGKQGRERGMNGNVNAIVMRRGMRSEDRGKIGGRA